MSKPLLEIKNLSIWFESFEGPLKVLDGVNMIVLPGEKVGLIGEMGCGKTTTMKAIAGILPVPPTIIRSGSILYQGEDLMKMNKKKSRQIRKKELSMIFQDPMSALNPVFTIGTQLHDIIKINEKKKGFIKGKSIQLLKEVLLPDPARILKNYPIQLSGGMRQRICIAMALINKGQILLADEPDTSLDVTIKEQIMKLLRELVGKYNKSIVLVSHALGTIKSLTDRVYVMYAGSMVEMASTQALFANPLHPYSKGLLEATPRLTGKGIGDGINGRIPEYVSPPNGCRFHPRCKEVMDVCRREKPSFFNVSKDHGVACFLFKNSRN